MKALKSFAPVSDSSARILILGSMPGEQSLAANQYYAHPRNAFWPIMTRILGMDPASTYDQRLLSLKTAGIALWDVLHTCIRPGSLDTSIDASSIKPNDFQQFYRRHPRIVLVCFNGTMAERCYRTHVLPSLSEPLIPSLRLPSTSPAHASRTFEQKLAAWSAAIGSLIIQDRA
jgi:TDG/mug DNA glycosylase family protein